MIMSDSFAMTRCGSNAWKASDTGRPLICIVFTGFSHRQRAVKTELLSIPDRTER